MVDVRCQCGKILCQHDTEVVIIKCRHCKRIINISINEVGKHRERHMLPAAKYIMAKPSAVNI